MKIFKDREQVGVIGRIVDVVVIDVADDAVFVDDEDDAVAVAVVGENAVFLGHFTVRPEIGQERIGDPAQRFGPGFVAGDGIDRDTQDLGVEGFELFQIVLIARYLFTSDRGPVEGIKGQNDVLAAAIPGQIQLPFVVRG